MVLLHFLVYYALPLVIIAVFYVLIALHLMYSASVPGEIQGAVRQVSPKFNLSPPKRYKHHQLKSIIEAPNSKKKKKTRELHKSEL